MMDYIDYINFIDMVNMVDFFTERGRKMCAILFKIINIFVFVVALSALNAKEIQVPVQYTGSIHATIPEDIAMPTRTIKPPMITLPKTSAKKLLDPEDISRRITPWEEYIQKYALQYNINPNFIRAIIYAESRGNPIAISGKGAQGLMQIMPATGNFMGINNLMNPDRNIEAGVKYIAWLLYHKKEYDEEHLLWAWNAGPGNVEKKIMPRETKNFIIKVLLIKRYLENT